MSRSEAVRQEALRLDNYRCQVTGFNGEDLNERSKLEVDHVRELGMGGSEERDVVENTITLVAAVHHLKTEKKFFIEKWDRENGILEIGDATHHIITHDKKALKKLFGIEEIWFYNKANAKRGEEITERLSGYSILDLHVARDVHELRGIYKEVDPLASSFREYLASRGIDPRLETVADLYAMGLKAEFEWQEGVSAVDYRRQMRDAGLIPPREYVYLELSKPLHELVGQGAIVPRWVTDEEFADLQTVGVKAGKWFGVKRHGKVLVQSDGHEIELIEKTKEAVTA